MGRVGAGVEQSNKKGIGFSLAAASAYTTRHALSHRATQIFYRECLPECLQAQYSLPFKSRIVRHSVMRDESTGEFATTRSCEPGVPMRQIKRTLETECDRRNN